MAKFSSALQQKSGLRHENIIVLRDYRRIFQEFLLRNLISVVSLKEISAIISAIILVWSH